MRTAGTFQYAFSGDSEKKPERFSEKDKAGGSACPTEE
jgi:hypothetical protein